LGHHPGFHLAIRPGNQPLQTRLIGFSEKYGTKHQYLDTTRMSVFSKEEYQNLISRLQYDWKNLFFKLTYNWYSGYLQSECTV
jgi:hypothetical protein